MLLIAFVGGLILNFMPCVLPVVSLKFLSLVKLKNHHMKQARLNLLAIACGVVTSFVVLAMFMASLKYAGQHVGLGFNFQRPMFIIALVLVLMLFASSVRGTITIDIPSRLKQFLVKHSDESRLLGSFASGAFATLLATPCTAPFIGTAISFAFTLSFVKILVVFAFIGLGMALPFIVLAIFPRALGFIPKPGPWLSKFNKFLELLLYMTVFWLLWILSGQLGLLSTVIVFGFCILLKCVVEAKLSWRVKLMGVVAIISCALVMPLKLSKMEHNIQQNIDASWHTFTHDKLEDYVNEGRVVLVDITADWCVTCKYNKFTVLRNPFFLKFIMQHNVILMKGEYTSENHEATRLLDTYARYGIPFTIVFSKRYPDGIILPTLFNYDDAVEAIQKAS